MMKAFSLLHLICLLILVTSCGGKDSSKGERIVRIPEEEVADIMANQNFSCAGIGGSGCPHGISRLFIINPADVNKSSVCSGFMAAPNVLVTNHHCVSSQAQCVNTFIAVYQGDTYLSTRCKRLIRTEEDFPEVNDARRAIDYSVLEIEGNYQGPVFMPAHDRPDSGDRITTWVVDHTGLDRMYGANLYESRITEFRCRASDQNERAALMLEQCPVVQGNSGSPALNDFNEVVGVIWGGSALFSSSLDLDVRRELDELAAATETIHFQDAIP